MSDQEIWTVPRVRCDFVFDRVTDGSDAVVAVDHRVVVGGQSAGESPLLRAVVAQVNGCGGR